MNAGFLKLTEIVEHFELDPDFIARLEDEEIICPVCREENREKVFSAEEIEKLRLAKILFEEMEVNLAGIEVILRMRENMLNMRKQFDGILEDLARRLDEKFPGRS